MRGRASLSGGGLFWGPWYRFFGGACALSVGFGGAFWGVGARGGSGFAVGGAGGAGHSFLLSI